MPTAGQWTWSDALDRIIRDEANAAGVPLDLAYTFIAVESSFNPNIHVDNALEDSVGLLQLNRRGGQGTGYTVAQLQDPVTNLRIGLPHIRQAFESSWAAGIAPRTFIYLVATRSGHPGQVAEDDYRINNIKNAWMIFYPAVGASLQGPGPSTLPSPPPTSAASPGLAANVGVAIFALFYVPAFIAGIAPNALSLGYVGQLKDFLLGGPVRNAMMPVQSPAQLGAPLTRVMASASIRQGRGARRSVSDEAGGASRPARRGR